jgi:hypothetical protein
MAQDAKNWKKRMYADMEKEIREERAQSQSGYAVYRENLTAVQFKKVLDFHQRNSSSARLPKMSKMMEEIRRFADSSAALEKEMKYAKADDLVKMLARALGHTPRRFLRGPGAPKKYHRFGLSFNYMGELPSSKYREGMSSEELMAWLELYPDGAITIAQLKACIKEFGEKTGGTKPQLLHRLRKCHFSYSWPNNLEKDHTPVECWADEAPALQARFDQLKEVWCSELEANKENASNFEKSKKQKLAFKDTADKQRKDEKMRELLQKQAASSRPWVARPYNPKLKSRTMYEAEWKKAHTARLSFAYSGAIIPPLNAFRDLLGDYKNDRTRNAHHMLAYLEYGSNDGWTIGNMYSIHKYFCKDTLKEIHGRICRDLGSSHQYAVRHLKSEVDSGAEFRFRNGL